MDRADLRERRLERSERSGRAGTLLDRVARRRRAEMSEVDRRRERLRDWEEARLLAPRVLPAVRRDRCLLLGRLLRDFFCFVVPVPLLF